MFRREALTRPVVLVLVAAAVIIASLIASAGTANAAAGDRLNMDPQYKGWGYLANTAAVPVWKYKVGGWTPTTIAAGETLYAHPYATGWHWVYYKAAWYVTQSKYVAKWSCDRWPFAFFMPERAVVYALNSTKARVLGVVAAGDVATQYCSNPFLPYDLSPDTTTSTQRFLLVTVAAKPLCLVPADPAVAPCVAVEPETGFPKVTGYVKLPAGF